MRKMYLFGFLVTILVLTASIGGVWIYEEFSHFSSHADELKNNHIASKREQMRREVEKIIDLIQFERIRMRKSVRTLLRDRVLEAYAIALETYQKNKGRIDDQEVKQKVIDQLKGIRFDNGLGYFFAAEKKSDREIVADRPELVGRTLIYLSDTSDEAEVRGMVGMATRQEEGFIQYRIPKPQQPGPDLPKLSFFKFFEPFGWYIGTGVYLDDLRRDAQKQVLDRVFSMPAEPDRDLYIIQFQGTVLFHGHRPYIGRNMLNWGASGAQNIFREMIRIGRQPGGGYIRFADEKPETGRPVEKIVFARAFDDWQWVIATDMSTEDILTFLAKENASLKTQVKNHIVKIMIIFIGFIFIAMVLSDYFSKRLDHEFRIFAEFFQNAASSHQEIDPTNLNMLEFRNLAVPANQMIQERKRAEKALFQLNEELEERVRQRTVQLEATNKELESFAYSVSHDLRAPLRAIDGFSQALLEDYFDQLDEEGRDFLHRVRAGSQRMGQLIDDILELSRLTRKEISYTDTDLSEMARTVVEELQAGDPKRKVDIIIASGMRARGDPQLLRILLENLLGNSWKFTEKKERARIEFGLGKAPGRKEFFVRDNGAGFDMIYADKLFGAFQRLHRTADFPGTGIGLATVQRVIHRHGGNIRAEAAVNEGATFHFTLSPDPEEETDSKA